MRTYPRPVPVRRLASVVGAGVLTLTLGSCGSSEPDAAADTAPSEMEAASLSMEDPWVKAAPDGMTAAFGTLVNHGDGDIVVTEASSDITEMMELHETVQNDDGSMAMQAKDGGFSIPAGGEHELAPGADHLMVMDLTRALKPGETVTFTLTLEDGSTTEVDAVVKRFTGADEKYQEGEMEMGG